MNTCAPFLNRSLPFLFMRVSEFNSNSRAKGKKNYTTENFHPNAWRELTFSCGTFIVLKNYIYLTKVGGESAKRRNEREMSGWLESGRKFNSAFVIAM